MCSGAQCDATSGGAGFLPEELAAATDAATPLEYRRDVSTRLQAGQIENGRRRILGVAPWGLPANVGLKAGASEGTAS